jgi:hypothetical protein
VSADIILAPVRSFCQLVCSDEALCYNPESRGFETRRSQLVFSMCLNLPAALDHGLYSASNINEYQKHTSNVSRSKARSVRRADNLAVICEPIV